MSSGNSWIDAPYYFVYNNQSRSIRASLSKRKLYKNWYHFEVFRDCSSELYMPNGTFLVLCIKKQSHNQEWLFTTHYCTSSTERCIYTFLTDQWIYRLTDRLTNLLKEAPFLEYKNSLIKWIQYHTLSAIVCFNHFKW